MKWLLRLLLLSIVGFAYLEANDEIITIYNKNFASIRQRASAELVIGRNLVDVSPIPTTILPSSVKIRDLYGSSTTRILEQQFRYDLGSVARVIEKSVGEAIEITTVGGRAISGTLVSTSDNFLTVRLDQNKIELLRMDQVLSISASDPKGELQSKPRLRWLVDADVAAKQDFEISYLADSVGWSADYVAVLNSYEDSALLSGWATLSNNSGRSFEDATIKLVAGDVNWDRPRPAPRNRDYGTVSDLLKAQVGVVERAFYEYHLYALERATDLADREMKQLPLFDPLQAAVKKNYVYDLLTLGKSVSVQVEFMNSKSAGLGIPLPGGMMRLMKADLDGAHEFLGETAQGHIAVDESFKLRTGTAFDIVAEPLLSDRRTEGKRTQIISCEFVIRNHKGQAVDVVCFAAHGGKVEIFDCNFPQRQVAPNRAEIVVHVDAGQEAKVSARVKLY